MESEAQRLPCEEEGEEAPAWESSLRRELLQLLHLGGGCAGGELAKGRRGGVREAEKRLGEQECSEARRRS